MAYNLTEALANNILRYMGYEDYKVTDIYEQSFKGYRKNEFMLSEINVEIFMDATHINNDNVHDNTNICIHVLKRYQ